MKYNRHAKILEIIESQGYCYKDELAERLRAWDGCHTSDHYPDIKERLVKVMTPEGKQNIWR